MKTIIAGSRTATRQNVLDAISACAWSNSITTVITGKAQGADAYGEEWARSKGIQVLEFHADWAKYGKRAGPIRNVAMANAAQALIAVWDGESRGTANMIEEARNRGLKVFVFRIDAKEDE